MAVSVLYIEAVGIGKERTCKLSGVLVLDAQVAGLEVTNVFNLTL